MTEWSVRQMLKDTKNPVSITQSLESQKLSRIGMNVYDTKVSQIPDGRIEYYLWYYGKCLIWRHKILGWVCTDFSVLGYDINGFPNRFKPTIDSGIQGIELPEFLTEDDDCIPFWDCSDPDICRSMCLWYCGDYADAIETIRTQIFNQKTPMIGVVGDPRLKDKIKQSFVHLANNAKLLFMDRSTKDAIETFDINPVYNVQSIWQYAKACESEMLESMGVDSKDAYQKKERLIVDEQEGNDELLNYLLADGLKVRQVAIDKCISKGLTATTEIQQLVRPIAEDELVDGNTESDNGDT